MTFRTTLTLGLLAASAALAGCTDSYYDNGYYGRGIATGYYAGPVGYGVDYYGGYGYPRYGVYNDFYYPGYGAIVFDRYGHRRPWNDAERAHWQYRGDWRGNHLYQNGRFDKRRDHAYAIDRDAAYRNFRSGGSGQHATGPRGDEHRRP